MDCKHHNDHTPWGINFRDKSFIVVQFSRELIFLIKLFQIFLENQI